MKAMQLHISGPVERRPLQWTEVENPVPGPGEILLKVRFCGVCRTDLHLVEGDLAMKRIPIIPGHQIVGAVASRGEGAVRFRIGDRVGVSWMHQTCGCCSFCIDDKENLCPDAVFTGWSVNGGFAEYAVVPESFACPLPTSFSDRAITPLLCAGVIGYRALKCSGIRPGQRLGLYGFGASARIAIQIARQWGCEVFVFTRSPGNRKTAERLGACWTASNDHPAPQPLHASIIFSPDGRIVPKALSDLERGGAAALAGIWLSRIPELDYLQHLYQERVLRSVANATRRDATELLDLAVSIPLVTTTRQYPLIEANEAMADLKSGKITGAAVLLCDPTCNGNE